LTYVTLFLRVTLVVRTRQHVDLLWRALVWASAPVVLYGLLQALRLDPLAWQSDSSSPILSTVGRSNFLGTYLVLIIPLTWGQLLVARARAGLMLLWAGPGSASPPTASSASYAVSGGYWRCAIAHDVNDDGLVTVYDIQVIADAWGDVPAPGYADRDGDGDVDMLDIQLVTAHWGLIC
jgi:hypothetical protein